MRLVAGHGHRPSGPLARKIGRSGAAQRRRPEAGGVGGAWPHRRMPATVAGNFARLPQDRNKGAVVNGAPGSA